MRLLIYLGVLAVMTALANSATAVSPLNETRSHSLANPASITFDALDGDWPAGTSYSPDGVNDANTGTDWEYLRFADDPTYLYGYFKTRNNGLGLGDLQFWFDMDENQGTGLAPNALPVGADNLIVVMGGSAHLTNSGVASIGFLDSQPGEAVAYAATPDGGYGLEFKILRSRLADDGNVGFDWWANSYLGGGDTYPQGSATPTAPHNKYVYANGPPPPPPPAIGTYTYETNPAIAAGPAGPGVLGDTGLTKLTDGVANNPNWLVGDPQWVGFQDPTFVPANLGGDNELPQPRVVFVTDPSLPLESVTITYLVENDAKIYAPDYVIASFSSDGGGTYGGDIAEFGFDNSPDGFPNPPDVALGSIRTLTIDLGGVTANRVRLDFFNDFEWTAIGEVSFTTVPEPSSGMLLAIGGAVALASKRRRTA